MITLTKEQLIDMYPCNLEKRLTLFGVRTEMNAKQAFEAGASIRDLLWVASRLGLKERCVKFALACAQRAGRFAKDERIHACLAATQIYIDKPSASSFKALRKARHIAAYVSDDVAYAAVDFAATAALACSDPGYAVYTAGAADYAATCVACVTYAAYLANTVNAANAVNAAAINEEIKEQQKLFLEIFS